MANEKDGYSSYLQVFQEAAGKLDKNVLLKKQVLVSVGEVLQSACLKLYKASWANPLPDALTAQGYFSRYG